MTIEAGRVISQRYRLLEPVGRGAQASVWLAEHLALGTQVAVKLIDQELAKQEEARERFRREATAAAKLRSAHVVSILDHGIDGDQPYIVMELLEGEDLFQRIDRLDRLSIAETSKIITQVARALARAHAAGIVHRDLKPENVFLVPNEDDEIAKVLDFGVAKISDPKRQMSSTGVGTLIGTPHYMSPEQVKGIGEVDHRADLWAVGVMAYQCVTGELPFESEGVGDLLIKISLGEAPIPSKAASGIPAAFDAWFAKACARDPSKRFQSARELAVALAKAVGDAAKPKLPKPRGASVSAAPKPPVPGKRASESTPIERTKTLELNREDFIDEGWDALDSVDEGWDTPEEVDLADLSSRPPPPSEARPEEKKSIAPRPAAGAPARPSATPLPAAAKAKPPAKPAASAAPSKAPAASIGEKVSPAKTPVPRATSAAASGAAPSADSSADSSPAPQEDVPPAPEAGPARTTPEDVGSSARPAGAAADDTKGSASPSPDASPPPGDEPVPPADDGATQSASASGSPADAAATEAVAAVDTTEGDVDAPPAPLRRPARAPTPPAAAPLAAKPTPRAIPRAPAPTPSDGGMTSSGSSLPPPPEIDPSRRRRVLRMVAGAFALLAGFVVWQVVSSQSGGTRSDVPAPTVKPTDPPAPAPPPRAIDTAAAIEPPPSASDVDAGGSDAGVEALNPGQQTKPPASTLVAPPKPPTGTGMLPKPPPKGGVDEEFVIEVPLPEQEAPTP